MPCRASASSIPASSPRITVSKPMPRSVWVCGSKKISAWTTRVRRGAIEIGGAEVAEIRLGAQHAGALVIDVEKVLQVGEAVGAPHLLDACERNVDAVALRQLEHQLGLEAALDMHVQLGLGQAGDEAVEIGHGPETIRSPAGRKPSGLPCRIGER